MTAEQITVIRSSLDASGYQRGADQIVAANAKLAASGTQMTEIQVPVTRSLVDSGSGSKTVKEKLDPAYASATAYAKTLDTITRAVQNDRDSRTTPTGRSNSLRSSTPATAMAPRTRTQQPAELSMV